LTTLSTLYTLYIPYSTATSPLCKK